MLKKIIMSFFIATNAFASLYDNEKTDNVSSQALACAANSSVQPSLPPLFDLENPPRASTQTSFGSISPLLDTPKACNPPAVPLASSSSSSSEKPSSSVQQNAVPDTAVSSAPQKKRKRVTVPAAKSAYRYSDLMRKGIACKTKRMPSHIKTIDVNPSESDSESDDEHDSNPLKKASPTASSSLPEKSITANADSPKKMDRELACSAAIMSVSVKFACPHKDCKVISKNEHGLHIHLAKKHRDASSTQKSDLSDNIVTDDVTVQNDEDSDTAHKSKRRKLNTPQASKKQSTDRQTVGNFICPHCKIDCHRGPGLASHVRFKHPDALQPSTDSNQEEEEEGNGDDSNVAKKRQYKKRPTRATWFYECTECSETFSDLSSVDAHEKLHHSTPAQAKAKTESAPNAPQACFNCQSLKLQIAAMKLLLDNMQKQFNGLVKNTELF